MNEYSGWTQKKLSEVGELIRGRRFTKSDYVDSGLGCIHYAQVHTGFGPVARESLTFLAEESRARMRLAHPGDLVIAATSENVDDVGKAVAWLGDGDVAVHDDCYIFRHNLNPVYVSYFFMSSLFRLQKIKYVSETKVVRISGSNLGMIEIPVPPQQVQEQIVEVIGAVDDQIAALDAEAGTARSLLNMVLAEHFTAVDGQPHRIVDLCSHVIGGVWGRPAGEDEVDRLALGPRIYTPGTSDFVTDGSPVRSFTTKQANTRTVREQDIVLERSGGSPDQPVGRVAIAGPGLEPCVPTDFQRLVRVDPEKALPKYVFWRLRNDWESGLTRNYSRRTTGITNLSVTEYIAREISLPSLEEQAGLAERAEAVDSLIVTLRAEAASLRQVRASLLSKLLNPIGIESAQLEVV
ncbi:restriction endonuclease subunit S [Dactylosporangium sp. NPDC006015]|uniref:restriction endonuclease subunit S n=1 Tax=Dactylosporangium sp. NPDC006015 TaxID=3154576 RepID=UPI0033B5C043